MSETWVPAKDELVEVKIGDDWVAARVERVNVGDHYTSGYLIVRRVGRNKIGHRYPLIPRCPDEVRKPLSPLPANVYADWLDDHGEPGAAKKLREAFPLVDSDT